MRIGASITKIEVSTLLVPRAVCMNQTRSVHESFHSVHRSRAPKGGSLNASVRPVIPMLPFVPWTFSARLFNPLDRLRCKL